MGTMKNVIAYLLLSTLQLASLDRMRKASGLLKNYTADRAWVARHYTSSRRLNKEWKGIDEETALMKALKSNLLESETDLADLLAENNQYRPKEQENQSQGAAAYGYSSLQSEYPRGRRSPGLNATVDGDNGRPEVGRKSRPNLKYNIDVRNAEGFTPLYLAVTNDHADIAASFHQAGADLQQTYFAEHRNLLHEAARKEAVNSIHWLVKAGLSINATDDNKWTPLHYAALNGRLNATKALIEQKCCIDCESSEGHTALRNALVKDDTTIAALLVESGADAQQTLYSDGRTLLHEASRLDALSSIRWLSTIGLSVNATNKDKWTPLHFAANSGRLDATKTLIELNSCMDCKSLEGYTAIRNAVANNYTTIAALLVHSGADVQQKLYNEHRTLLHEASSFDAVNSIHWLVEKGLRVNATDDDGWMPLHYAAYEGKLNATKTLIELKSCLDCKSSEGHTALRNALANGHTAIADLLVDSGADVHQKLYNERRTLLQEASSFDAVSSIKWLVGKGLRVNTTDDDNLTPLHYAAINGRLNATKLLIKLKSCIACKSLEGHTALERAVVKDHTNIADLLVNSGADVHQKLYKNHINFLHEAASFDAVNSIHWLVEKGLSVNATDDNSWTPLHYAASKGNLNATKALIELKSCIGCKSIAGHTALRNALANDHTNIAALLVESGAEVHQTLYDDRRTLLHEASRFDAVNSIHWLIKNGVSVNATDNGKFTALHFASFRGKLNATKALIELKVCIDCKSSDGDTALHNAVAKDNTNVAALLVDSGADVQQKLFVGHRTLLHEASGADAVNSIRWLVKKGLSVNATDDEKLTPLHYAAYRGKLKAARTLIELKACIDCESSKGLTALQNAVAKDDTNIAALLVESGADVHQKLYDEHRTLLHEASLFDAVTSIRWLSKKGLSVNATDDVKFTPLHYAAYHGKMNAAKTLVELKACINCKSSYGGTSLQYAEMKHHQDIAAFLKSKGATNK